jgi:glyoxylase I family protein
MASFRRASHVGLTVRDMEVSSQWYQRVLGFKLVKRFDTRAGEGGIPRILLLHPDSGFLVSLCNHPGRSGDLFSPLRTGLDHLALEVGNQADLDEHVSMLDALGVEHSPIRDLRHSRFVSLEDPDGIQLELWLTIVPHRPAAAETTRPRMSRSAGERPTLDIGIRRGRTDRGS